MSLAPLIQKLEKLKVDIPALVDRLAPAIANDIASVITNRTQIQGKNVSGTSLTSSGGPYTVAYQKFKSRKGRQTTFVDLTFTGEMLQSIGLVDKTFSGSVLTLTIAPSEGRRAGNSNFGNKAIMEVQEERFGEIMGLSDEEGEKIIENIINILQRQINQALE